MGPTEWSFLFIAAVAMAYFIGLRAGFEGGRGHERYLASIEKLKDGVKNV